MPRRLLLLFAALLAVLGASPAAAPAHPAPSAENCARAFPSAATTHTPGLAAASPCTHPGSNAPTLRIAAGCCVAAKGVRPPNLSPTGAGRRGALGQAKRDAGIPRSQQPARTRIERDRATGKPQRVYEYDTPDGPVSIRDHPYGHRYPDDPSQDRGGHFNGPDGGHYDYP